MSKRSPSHRAPKATRTYNRQEFRMIMWLHVTVVSAVVMLAASLLSGSIGDRRFYCSMIGSSAAIILSVCLVLSFPTLVRMMREQLEGPGAARPAVAALVMILLFALVAAFLSYKGSTSVVHLIGDARSGHRTLTATKCERFRQNEYRGYRQITYYSNEFTLQFEDGSSHNFDVSTWTSGEFRREKSPYYPVYQLCVVRPKTTTFIVDFYPRSGIIKAIREA